MNRTKNYQLCLWDESDRILMEEFNGDSRKIEAALTELSENQTAESIRLDQAIASARNALTMEDARLSRVKSEFVSISPGLTGTLSNMTRTYSVSGWSGYSIVCLDVTTPSGYNYTLKVNGQGGTFWTAGGTEYGKGIAYLHGGVTARLVFFPMRDANAAVSCFQMYSLPGFGFASGVAYSQLKTIEITPEGAVAFSSPITVKISAVK